MKRLFFKLYLLLFALTIITFLARGTSLYAQKYPKGQVVDTVWCAGDTSQSYALYLPSNYNPQYQWPAMIVFEPAARGGLPVNKFMSGAEELGYILIGSNNSRNGSWEIAFNAADAIFLDIFDRFSIDPDRVYTSGFSGGSRIATSVAVITDKIAGIVACGAGYPNVPQYQPTVNSKFVYCALVGNQDMNYLEHLKVAEDLKGKGISNNLIIFPAGHQWPPASFLKESLYWLEFQFYRRGVETNSSFSHEKLYDLMKYRADSVFQKGNFVEALRIYKCLEESFQEYIDLKSITEQISTIERSKELKKQQRKKVKLNSLEMSYRFKMGEAFTELTFTRFKSGNDTSLKDMDWWKNEIDQFKRMAGKRDVYKSNMALRVLNMIWARCAETSFTYASRQDYEMAMILNEIWLYVEPESVWGHWSMARLFAQTGDVDGTIEHLKAVKEYRPGIPFKALRRDVAFEQVYDHIAIQRLLKENP
ncbi:hypothetical protein JMN32_26180 [Fulvivirga sp. 29W222]|uniref:Uncharacterized protein n=1 Tax=Fulvivirga marina TaxID=2494733 RepID=A0A937G355_9BACT|nr:hypothetical protein [Fulvivirga marina]MBL6449827.1 hypothetical protein [Fulvivirga marina]